MAVPYLRACIIIICIIIYTMILSHIKVNENRTCLKRIKWFRNLCHQNEEDYRGTFAFMIIIYYKLCARAHIDE